MIKTNEQLFQEFWKQNETVYPTTHTSAAKAIFMNACMLKDNIQTLKRESEILKFLEAEKKRQNKSWRVGWATRRNLIDKIVKKVKEM